MNDDTTGREVTLSTIGDGVLEELFQVALAEMHENIQNPNTDARTKRSFTLTFEFMPVESRDGADVILSSKSKLAPPLSVMTSVNFAGGTTRQPRQAVIRATGKVN